LCVRVRVYVCVCIDFRGQYMRIIENSISQMKFQYHQSTNMIENSVSIIQILVSLGIVLV